MCRPMASSAFTSATKFAGWRDYGTPCTYIKCIGDRAVPESKCDEYIARMQQAGVEVEVISMSCGHSPALVAPAALTEELLSSAAH